MNHNIHKIEGGFETESGLYQKEVEVKLKGKDEIISMFLLGTEATLELVGKDKILVVPNRNE